MLVARKGRVAYLEAVGFRDKTAGAPMTPEAIFRLASMTKPMVTVAAMTLYEEGRLFPSDPVSKYLPAFSKLQVGVERVEPGTGKSVVYTVPPEREMTIQDLMRHTSGLTYGNRGTTAIHKMYPESSNVSSQTLTMDEFIERLARTPLLYQPGTTWEYGLSTDVLGRVVEVVSGKPLAEFLEERIFQPLKMTDTGFLVPAAKRPRIAQPLPTHPDTGKEYTVPDPSVPRKFDCGGGCAVSTAPDYVALRADAAQPRSPRRRARPQSQDRRLHDVRSPGLIDLARQRLHRRPRLHVGSGLRRAPGEGDRARSRARPATSSGRGLSPRTGGPIRRRR